MLTALLLHGFILVGFLVVYSRWLDQEVIADVCLYGLLIETLGSCFLVRYMHVVDTACLLALGAVSRQPATFLTEPLLCFDVLSGFFLTILVIALSVCFFFLVEYFEYDSQASGIILLSAFFSQLALLYFSAFDLGLVLFFWEAISLVSFLLVQHWSFRLASYKAGLRVFVISQVGDFFLFLSLFLLLARFQTTSLAEILSLAATTVFEYILCLGILVHYPSLVAVGLYVALCLKAAQCVFYPWLLDAMEAPVPISAQLHSSTLVVIGFYLVFRFQPFLILAPQLASTILLVGVITSIGASVLGFFQDDGKKLLACSTAGQLGYVVTALGLQLFGEALLLLAFCCCNKAVAFIWFGLIMQRTAGVSDFRRLGQAPVYWPEHAGVLVSLCNFTVLPGAFVWHVKGLFLGGQVAPLLRVTELGLGLLEITWVFSSLYLGYLYIMLFWGGRRLGAAECGWQPSLIQWLGVESGAWASLVRQPVATLSPVRSLLWLGQFLLVWHGGSWGLLYCDFVWLQPWGGVTLGYF